MSKYYVLEGRTPVAVGSVHEWATRFDENTRRVAKDEVGGVSISTVFLGLDHSYDEGPPVLFETMVFGGALDEEQERYCTYDAAEAGHKAMIERVKATLS